MEKTIYSVGQINKYIKDMFAQDFLLHNLCVKGEVSNCKYHSSGHIYFTLKDGDGEIRAIMFAGNRRTGLNFQMKDGDKVIITGSIEIYEKGGTYQIYAKQIELDGTGNLYLKFEALKKELEEMGMFDSLYKKPIPRFIKRLGVVTAPTGAAVQDIRNVATRRNPYVQIILYPALVQGEGAKESVVRGIETLDAMGVDVIIVGRGGGSMEDLWAFNEEIVARAIFSCNTPIISAVGHETDWTIADYVSDLRAPTPSAAAELAVFDVRAITDSMAQYELSMRRIMGQKLELARARLATYTAKLKAKNPQSILHENRKRAADLEQALQRAMEELLLRKRGTLAVLAGRMDANSPTKKLSQGFAMVESHGQLLKSAADLKEKDELVLHLIDGDVKAEVTEVTGGIVRG